MSYLWTDDPLTIHDEEKEIHLSELRSAINAEQIRYNVSPTVYSSPLNTVKAQHINELRDDIETLDSLSWCTADNILDYSVNDASEHAVHKSNYDSGDDSSVFVAHFSLFDSQREVALDASLCITDEGSNESVDDAADCPIYHATFCDADNSAELSGHNDTDYDTYQADNNTSLQTADHSAWDGADQNVVHSLHNSVDDNCNNEHDNLSDNEPYDAHCCCHNSNYDYVRTY